MRSPSFYAISFPTMSIAPTLMSRLLAVVVLLVGLAACTSSRDASGPAEPSEPMPEPSEEPIDLSAYETFDASPYESEPVQRRVEVDHRVPRALMEGRADAGEEVTMQGYRIQIYSTLEQGEADSLREAFQRLWRRHYRATADTTVLDSLGTDTTAVGEERPLPPEPPASGEGSEDDEEPLQGPFLTTVFDQRPGIYLVYKQPYYRIRVGNFARRADAEQALDVVKPHFPNAFVVPDEVTVVR